MPPKEETQRDWLTLIRTPGVGPVTAARLLAHFGDPRAILAAGDRGWGQLGLEAPARTWLAAPDEDRLDRDQAWLAEPGHHLITLDSNAYPQRLREIPDPPTGLFAVGDPDTLETVQLAMVGSRNPTAAGREHARAFAACLAGSGLVITSGLALGIDGEAHRGAVDAGGLSIAVCATGLDRVYPARHRALAHDVAAQGALVSEFPPGTPPLPQHFPRRNRIISGLALGVLVVEAARRSGSLITARLAMEQGREVFAIPGSVHSPLARGCHRLIREGAKLVESADDILEELGPLIGSAPSFGGPPPATNARTPQDAEPALDPEYQSLLQHMGFEPLRVNDIVTRSGLTPETVSSMLLMLELRGMVSQTAGGTYIRLHQGLRGK